MTRPRLRPLIIPSAVRRRVSPLRRWGWLACAALVASCSSSDEPAPVDPEDPGPGVTGPIQAMVDASGATLQTEAITVRVPAGAVTEPTTIEITPVTAPAGEAPVGPWYALAPEGLRFAQPVTVEIAVDADAPRLAQAIERSTATGGVAGILSLRETTFTPADGGPGVAVAQIDVIAQGIGPVQLNCPIGAPTVTADGTWDVCTQSTNLSWMGTSSAFIEYGVTSSASAQRVDWIEGRADVAGATADFDGAGGPQYVFRLHATTQCGADTLGTTVRTVEVASEALPMAAAPAGLIAERQQSELVVVQWTAPSMAVDGYTIGRLPPFPGGDVTLEATATRFEDPDVNASEHYSYTINAFIQACGRQVLGAPASASTADTPALPEDVSALVVRPLSPTAIGLDWTAADRAAEYVITRGGGDATFDDVVVAYPDTDYVDRSVSPDTAYIYTVTARNVDGSSGSATATTRSPQPGRDFAVTCGDLRMTIVPTLVETTVQRNGCMPGTPGCPNDATFQILIEWLAGSTSDVQLRAQAADADAAVIFDQALGGFGSRDGTTTGLLSGGTASQNTSFEVQTPDTVLDNLTLPVTWNLVLQSNLVGGEVCELPVSIVVEE